MVIKFFFAALDWEVLQPIQHQGKIRFWVLQAILTLNQFTFLIFFGIFELGSLICGVAQSSKMLIVGRAVAGMGAAGLQNGGLTILSSCAPPEKRPGKHATISGAS
jgi:MFS family permease